MSDRTPVDVRRDYRSTLLQFEEERDAAIRALDEEYQPRLRSLAAEYTMLVETAPVKIEKGTPPNENSNPVPPICSI